MNTSLVVASLAGETFDDTTCQTVTAALALGGHVTLGIVASDPEAVAATRGLAGVNEVVGVRISAGAAGSEIDQHAVRTIINNVKPRVILMGFGARTAAFAAALAHELDLGFASNVVRVGRDEAGGLTATKLLYGGKVHAELGFDHEAPALLLLRPSVWNPAEACASIPCRIIESATAESRLRHVAFIPLPDSGLDLTRQDVILSIGRGVGSKEAIGVFSEVAEKLGAALAASRPIVDAGWLPRERQVGQSGASVAPRVYIAFGISGALQHIAGIRGAKSVIAINNDGEAPIFSVATYGAVADMFEVANELKKKLA